MLAVLATVTLLTPAPPAEDERAWRRPVRPVGLLAKQPEAMIVVYPHDFSGAEVPGFGVRAARQPFDPRWTLSFTPHSAHLDPALIRRAKSSLWWDDSPALRSPQDITQP
jgi:hypothetical protein